MSIVKLFKGMLLSGGFVTTRAALERVAPEVLAENGEAGRNRGLPQGDTAPRDSDLRYHSDVSGFDRTSA